MQMNETLRDNWYLLAIIVVVILILIIGISRSNDGDSDQDGVTQAQRPVVTVDQLTQDELHAVLERDPGPMRPGERELILQTITSHQAAFDAEPESPDAPAYLRAMANLQLQKLGEYEEAARNYEQIILNYPEWESTRMVYGELMTCYEMLNDSTNVAWLANLMMERFPDDSEEYHFAMDKVGLYQPAE